MDPYRERMAAFNAYWASVRLFRDRPFPHDWAKVVNGVGLASFSMQVERRLGELSSLSYWKPAYLYSTGQAQSAVANLQATLAEFDSFLPALPPEPRSYFEDLRSLVADAIAFTEAWWVPFAAGEAVSRE